jgi:hypothetical protein
MFRQIRSLAFVFSSLTLFWSVAPTATLACKGTCSDSEQTSCNNTHSSCVTGCGDGTKTGASGLPEPDPNYQGCVKSCDDKLCACLDDCGDSCNKSNGNLGG